MTKILKLRVPQKTITAESFAPPIIYELKRIIDDWPMTNDALLAYAITHCISNVGKSF